VGRRNADIWMTPTECGRLDFRSRVLANRASLVDRAVRPAFVSARASAAFSYQTRAFATRKIGGEFCFSRDTQGVQEASFDRRAAGYAGRVSTETLCLDRSGLNDLSGYLSRNEFFWLDIHDPTPDEIKQLGELLKLHPLTLEDISTFSERPKREHYDNYVSLVVYGVDATAAAGESLLREVHMLISGGYVVTLHPSPFSIVDELQKRLKPIDFPGEQALIYRILDAILSTYVPVLDRVDDQIDALEQEVIEKPREECLQQIFSLKRDLIGMRRVITPMRDFFARDATEISDLPGMQPDDAHYFRDLYDTLVRSSDLVDSYRDLLSGATDMYLSTVANRQGEIAKQLTIIATIFLPLSFLTGFFGQNFTFLTNHILNHNWSFFVLGLGLLGVSVGILWYFFRKRGWLDPD
jgi:magnesium transporter